MDVVKPTPENPVKMQDWYDGWLEQQKARDPEWKNPSLGQVHFVRDKPAAELVRERLEAHGRATLVLCGAKVCSAFTLDYRPFSASGPVRVMRGDHSPFGEVRYVTLPHPSGLCRAWNQPGAFEAARAALRAGGVDLSGTAATPAATPQTFGDKLAALDPGDRAEVQAFQRYLAAHKRDQGAGS